MHQKWLYLLPEKAALLRELTAHGQICSCMLMLRFNLFKEKLLSSIFIQVNRLFNITKNCNELVHQIKKDKMQLCCTNTTVQMLLLYGAPDSCCLLSQHKPHQGGMCAGAKRKESKHRAHLKDRFCPITHQIVFSVRGYALPTHCLLCWLH